MASDLRTSSQSARGREATPDSDYDIAVFLREPKRFWKKRKRTSSAQIETDILYDSGAVINALPFAAESDGEPSPLMREISRDGRDL